MQKRRTIQAASKSNDPSVQLGGGSEGALREMMSHAPAGIALYRGATYVLEYINAGGQEILSGRGVIGRPLFEFAPEIEGTPAHEALERGVAGEAMTLKEFLVPLDPGTGVLALRYFDVVTQPVEPLDGAPGVMVFVVEVTEQVQARKRAEDLAQINTILTDNATLGLIMMDDRQRCTFMNPAAEEITGVTFEEVRNQDKPLHDIIHHIRPDGSPYPMAECPIDRALPTKARTKGEDTFVRPDGTMYPVAFTASPIIREGRPVGTVIEVRDTTEERRARRRLAASEERLRLLVQSLKEHAVFMLHPDGRVASWNPGAEKIKGYTADEIIGRHFSIFYTPEDLKDGKPERELKVAVRDGKYEEEGVRVRKDGSTFIAQIVLSPVYDDAGNLRGFSKVTRDVTEQKALERQKDDFIGIASHELKTPVTSMKIFSQLLERRFERRGDTESAAGMARINGQLDKLTALIGDLLDVTKIESGRLQFQPSRFDFDELVNETVESMQLTTNRHKLCVKGRAGIEVASDRDRVGQVLINLLSNAIKYSPHSEEIDIYVSSGEGAVTVAVEDFGVGISEEKQARVFERFFRVSGPGRESFPGLGLGLYISSEIIRRLGGGIKVESREGTGSRFSFSLPLEHPTLEVPAARQAAEEEMKHE